MMVRPLSRKDIFYSGSVVNLPEYQSQKSLANYRQSVISIPKSVRGIDMKDGDIEKAPQRMYKHMQFFSERSSVAISLNFRNKESFNFRTFVSLLGTTRLVQGSFSNHDGYVVVEGSCFSFNRHQQRVWYGWIVRSFCILGGRSGIGRTFLFNYYF